VPKPEYTAHVIGHMENADHLDLYWVNINRYWVNTDAYYRLCAGLAKTIQPIDIDCVHSYALVSVAKYCFSHELRRERMYENK